MEIETITSPRGELSRCSLAAGETINTASDFMDVIMNCPTPTIVLERQHFSPDFFDLKTRLAGDCLQKISNYRKRLVVLGDFSDIPGSSWRDFMRESNQYGQVVFADKLETAIELLQ